MTGGVSALRAGRRAGDVRLVAVSKSFPVEAMLEAYDAGQRDFGENRVQEALQKIARLSDKEIGWHLVGHLQSNKAKKAAARIGWIHAIDDVEVLRRVDEGAVAAGRTVDVLIQVDLALEPTKHGAPVERVPALIDAALPLSGARLVGVMLLPPLVNDPEDARPWFRRLRELRDDWARLDGVGGRLVQLSMGMSQDFEVAVEEGATMVRVGSAIFGERSA